MAKKSYFQIDREYLLIIVLLLFSGNPITRSFGKYAILATSVLLFIALYPKIKKDFYAKFLGVAAALMLIFISQNYVLGSVSWLGAFNYIIIFLLGGLILYIVGDNVPYKLFTVVSYISLISLILFPVFNILNLRPPGLLWGEQRFTYLIYTYAEEHHFRNCGMFWEPGAFAGILTLCMAMNIKELPSLWKKDKFKVVVTIMALITTQSTTGYFTLFIIGAYYLLFFVRDKTIGLTLLPVLLVIGVIVYTNATFLKEKVEYQSELTLNLDKGEFSNSRFGSLIFDMRYIKKHPIIGNGFNEVTRYADDPELLQLIQGGANLANGNGFSNYIACMGIPFMFFYFLLSFKAAERKDRRIGFLLIIVTFLTLFGEQWLAYPLFTGLIFMKFKKNDFKKINSGKKNQFSNQKHLREPYNPGYNISSV